MSQPVLMTHSSWAHPWKARLCQHQRARKGTREHLLTRGGPQGRKLGSYREESKHFLLPPYVPGPSPGPKLTLALVAPRNVFACAASHSLVGLCLFFYPRVPRAQMCLSPFSACGTVSKWGGRRRERSRVAPPHETTSLGHLIFQKPAREASR